MLMWTLMQKAAYTSFQQSESHKVYLNGDISGNANFMLNVGLADIELGLWIFLLTSPGGSWTFSVKCHPCNPCFKQSLTLSKHLHEVYFHYNLHVSTPVLSK